MKYVELNVEYNERVPMPVQKIDILANSSLLALRQIVGPKTAVSVYNWFRTPENIEVIARLREANVLMN